MRIFRKQWQRFIGRYPELAARLLGEYPLVKIAEHNALQSKSAVPDGAIPQVVYQTWDTRFLGKTHAAALERFRAQNPEFAFVLITKAERDAFMEAEYAEHPILEIYRRGQFGPLKVDIWRYCFIYKRGGIYFDINKCLKQPIRKQLPPDATAWLSYETTLGELFPPLHAIQWMQHPNNLLANWAFGFSAGHPMLAKTIDLICAYYPMFEGKVFAQPKNAIVKFTGPVMLTLAWHEHLQSINDPTALNDVCQADIDFNWQADTNMPRSWVRYAQIPAYTREKNRLIVS
jgi:mannosyltransferase OCH1-like enzyme